ncbi:FERM, ARHGEF and pleckstrin domain-containing protein 2 [Nymphon striatum]|nr:FERM, ARHGEF and pleckstrin domain-containing protein 2 [Nymphon striatum]
MNVLLRLSTFESPPSYSEVTQEESKSPTLEKPETIEETDEVDSTHQSTSVEVGTTEEVEAQETPHDLIDSPVNNLIADDISSNNCANPHYKLNMNQVHYILKELLMTERTYKKDLEVLSVWFCEAVNDSDGLPQDLLHYLFSHVEPIYQSQEKFLCKLEERLSNCDGRSNVNLKPEALKIGDLMLENLSNLNLYKNYTTCQKDIIDRLPTVMEKNKTFEETYKNFEMQKVCYLPLTVFILKPAQRLCHHRMFLEKLLQCYLPDHHDYNDCKDACEMLKEYTDNSKDTLYVSENGAKLLELQRDLLGFDNLIQPKRKFLREGSLQKYSKKGFQQRIFFLFSDLLIYGNKVSTTSLQFKVHGHMPLSGLRLEETESKLGADHCFTIYGTQQALLLAASTENQKIKWMNDIAKAVENADDFHDFVNSNDFNLNDDINSIQKSICDGDTKQNAQRSNTTVQVCWHRNTSIGMDDYLFASQNQLSGFLLRKFKSSNGWQKLWVVFTNFCLFFYKSYQGSYGHEKPGKGMEFYFSSKGLEKNDFPLASLPLLGYSVSLPHPADAVKKEYVFKLQFKYHVYFFRAENEYFFNRWMEVIGSATINSEHSAVDSSYQNNYNY